MPEPKYSLEQYQTDSEEMASTLGYNRQYLCVLAKEGKIPAVKRFRQWLFCKEEVLSFLRDQAVAQKSNESTKQGNPLNAKHPIDSDPLQ